MAFEEDLQAAVSRYLEQSRGGSRLVETDAALAKPVADLDRLWWKRVELLLQEQIRRDPEHLQFGLDERLIIDMGLLSDELLRDEAPRLRSDLLKELAIEGEKRFYYLSEWMADRLRNHIALEGLKQPAEKNEEAAPDIETPILKSLRDARLKLYQAMGPFFENLPGFTPQAVLLLSSGTLDERLSRLRVAAAQDQMSQRDRLLNLRSSILSRARSRCTTPAQLEIFDLLATVDQRVESEQATIAAPSLQVDERVPLGDIAEQRSEFLVSELKIVRSNIRLGIAGAGITRTHSVLLSGERRTSKTEIADLMRHIEEVDPRLPGRPNILIAPFTGSGFFEWDRDTVYVPLISTRNTEESVVNGIGNYRIMVDNLHDGGRLKKLYKSRFLVEDFRAQFLRDYRNWVLGIGRGFRGAMSPDAYEFFRQVIGPNVEHLFAPADLIRLTPNEIRELRKSLRAKMNRGDAVYEDHLKLAYVYHRECIPTEALDQLGQAVRMNPTDGRTMFAYGWMCRRVGKLDKAKQALKECLNVAPNTIWHIYASDELGKIA